MPPYLLTYDLEETSPDPHGLVRSALKESGWYPRLVKDEESWAYPATTMSGSFDTDEAAIQAFRDAIFSAEAEAAYSGKGDVVVEKVYITRRTEVLFETDDKRPRSR